MGDMAQNGQWARNHSPPCGGNGCVDAECSRSLPQVAYSLTVLIALYVRLHYFELPRHLREAEERDASHSSPVQVATVIQAGPGSARGSPGPRSCVALFY